MRPRKWLPSGEIIEVHKPLPEDARAHVSAKVTLPRLEAGRADANGVPKAAGPIARLRAGLNHAYTDNDIPLEGAHEDERRPELKESGHASPSA